MVFFIFSKATDSIIALLAAQSDILLSTAEISLCKKSEKVSCGSCMTCVNGSSLFPDSDTLSQAFKADNQHNARVSSSSTDCTFISAKRPSPSIWSVEISLPLAQFCCAISFASSLHHKNHCKYDVGSSIAFAVSFQSWGIILYLIAQEVRICFTNGKCIPNLVTLCLNFLSSNTSVGCHSNS